MQSIIPLNLSWRAGNNTAPVITAPGANSQPMMNGPQNGEFLQSMIGQLDMEITDKCAQILKDIDFDKLNDTNEVTSIVKKELTDIVESYMRKYEANLKGTPYLLSSTYERAHFGDMYKKESYIDVEKKGIEISPFFILNVIRYAESYIQIANKNI